MRPSQWPTREKMERLPPFDDLPLDDVVVVDTPAQAHRTRRILMEEPVVGFDTESRPTFRKGQVSNGPHVVQFSTTEKAYVFSLSDRECRRTAADLIAADGLQKVGFGLSGDLSQIRRKLDVEPRNVLDIETLFAAKGFGRGVGLKVGVALTMKRRFTKSKKISTSNWSVHPLTDRQLHYAANDAYAALRVFLALTSPPRKSLTKRI
jgi:ribonuclease D